MKTQFTPEQINKALEYSETPEILRDLIDRLDISIGSHTVIPSRWRDDMLALHMSVTINGYRFDYYGSHYNAQLYHTEARRAYGAEARKITIKRRRFRESLLYNILCCVSCDISTLHCDIEDFGYNRDSIKDVAKWNECLDHAHKLQATLKLTSEELESLPS